MSRNSILAAMETEYCCKIAIRALRRERRTDFVVPLDEVAVLQIRQFTCAAQFYILLTELLWLLATQMLAPSKATPDGPDWVP
jgi:hypothetical protein